MSGTVCPVHLIAENGYLFHAHKYLNGLILRQAELVEVLGCMLRALFCSLPELALVFSREWHDVFLREMAEDSMTLLYQLIGAEGNGHIYHAEFPLLPGSAIEPDVAFLCPVVVFHYLHSAQHSFDAYTMGAVWVGEVAGSVNLVWFDGTQKLNDNVNISFSQLAFLDGAALVEGQVKEVHIRSVVKPYATVGSACFGATDCPLDVKQLTRLGLSFHFILYKIADFLHTVTEPYFTSGVEILDDDVVLHGYVSACLIGDVHIVLLLDESAEGASHRDDIVVGMG